jgi:hypothetical protein
VCKHSGLHRLATTTVVVRDGQSTPVNVSLCSEWAKRCQQSRRILQSTHRSAGRLTNYSSFSVPRHPRFRAMSLILILAATFGTVGKVHGRMDVRSKSGDVAQSGSQVL